VSEDVVLVDPPFQVVEAMDLTHKRRAAIDRADRAECPKSDHFEWATLVETRGVTTHYNIVTA